MQAGPPIPPSRPASKQWLRLAAPQRHGRHRTGQVAFDAAKAAGAQAAILATTATGPDPFKPGATDPASGARPEIRANRLTLKARHDPWATPPERWMPRHRMASGPARAQSTGPAAPVTGSVASDRSAACASAAGHPRNPAPRVDPDIPARGADIHCHGGSGPDDAQRHPECHRGGALRIAADPILQASRPAGVGHRRGWRRIWQRSAGGQRRASPACTSAPQAALRRLIWAALSPMVAQNPTGRNRS